MVEDMNTILEEKQSVKPTLAEVIASHRFFAGMKPEHIKILAETAMFKEFGRNEWICHEGDPANRFYLICSGKVAFETRRNDEPPVLAHFICEGEELGWSWLFPPYYWQYDARAVEPTTAIFFYGTRLRARCEENPAFGCELMKRIAGAAIRSLQLTRAQLIELQQARVGIN
jgi:CRP/FNR family transcriptional regulator, cyclic AMP receptor protein